MWQSYQNYVYICRHFFLKKYQKYQKMYSFSNFIFSPFNLELRGFINFGAIFVERERERTHCQYNSLLEVLVYAYVRFFSKNSIAAILYSFNVAACLFSVLLSKPFYISNRKYLWFKKSLRCYEK